MTATVADAPDLDALLRENELTLLRRWLPTGMLAGKTYIAVGWTYALGYGSWRGPGDEEGVGLLRFRATQRGLRLDQARRQVIVDLQDLGLIEPDASDAPVTAPKGPKYKPILPVPPDAPALDWATLPTNELAWRRLGMKLLPTAAWTYRDSEGFLLGYVVRFDPPHPEPKIVKRLLWCGSGVGWRFTDFPRPYPLYGQELLRDRPNDPVLVIEGEKTCDAARLLFPNYVVVAWPNGAETAQYARWELLKGRRVVLWPDHDDPGRRAMEVVRHHLRGRGGTKVGLVELPPEFPPHWDLGDPPPPGHDPIKLLESAGRLPAEVEELNQRHMVVREQGQTVVYSEVLDPVLDHLYYVRSSFDDIRKLYLNRQTLGVNRRGIPELQDLGSYWLEHPGRREYQGLTFSPSKPTPGYLNLWRGFAFEATAGDWSLLKAHTLENVCRGDVTLFEYVMSWLARMVQQPDQPGRTAIVMRGRRGTGKGVLAQAIGKLFGPHFIHLSNAKHLTGHFNAHLRSAVFLYADEAFWAGDKHGEATLKTLITEDRIPIEGKGRDVIMAPNMTHLIISSNADWVVPAGLEERRFLVLDVADHRMQDRNYFGQINDQLRAGGYAGLLHDLMNYDLGTMDLDPWVAPKTAGLLEQKLRSLDPPLAWWLDLITEGKLPGDERGEGRVPFAMLVDSFLKSVRGSAYTGRGASTKLALDLPKWTQGSRWPRAASRETYREAIGYDADGQVKLTEKIGRVYYLPPLVECRRALERLTGQPMAWADPLETWQPTGWGEKSAPGANVSVPSAGGTRPY